MIHGIFYRKPSPHRFEQTVHLDELTLNPRHERIHTWSSNTLWLARAFETEALQHTPHMSQPIVAWARLDNREELITHLQLPRAISDTDIVLATYQAYGENCTSHLLGDFCFVIYNTDTKTLFCARDQMGVKPFYYYCDEHIFVFSTSLVLFHKLDYVPVKPSMAWACKFLVANLSMDFEKTAYDKILKLPPASQICVTQTRLSKTRYFEFHTEKVQFNNADDYVAYYQEALERAIKTRIQTPHPLGTESSGGLDSSTITAYTAKYFNRSLKDLYVFGFAQLEKEAEDILSLSQQYHLANNYISCNPLTTHYKNEHALRTLGAPVEHANATAHQIFYELAAKHHIKTLLSGFGGDEFVTTPHGNLYFYELLHKKKYYKLYQSLHGNPLTRALRFAKFRYQTTATGGCADTRILRVLQSRWPDMIVPQHLVSAYNLQEKYHNKKQFVYNYKNLDEFTLENRWAPFVTTRLENCTLMAASYGIEYRWPLLDSRLIQCFLSIPSAEKCKGGSGRYLHARAVSGIVPSHIAIAHKKNMGDRVTPYPKAPTLNEALHPDLQPLIDFSKLNTQVNALKESPKSASHTPVTMQPKRNVEAVNQLDNWLKYYFPNGCDWADTPA